jgi:hypothetical protein
VTKTEVPPLEPGLRPDRATRSWLVVPVIVFFSYNADGGQGLRPQTGEPT